MPPSVDDLRPTDTFPRRHIGPDESEVRAMLDVLGFGSLDELVERTLPAAIRSQEPLPSFSAGEPRGEHEFLRELRSLARENRVFRSYIGLGYHGTIVPPVVQRNVLENPGWYTQYTPYQAEISQGRLEALLVVQTVIADLTGLPLANASLLDEATAAAEAMSLCHRMLRGKRDAFFVSADCHPQ
ncbi:MAG: glycine dehydrogenase (aminomethyl-transferring), partial [Planctomycetota bacterium]|nr:glycine dehydrogenase (aminomethyl-transferring) [Planctomycetota bacterium]